MTTTEEPAVIHIDLFNMLGQLVYTTSFTCSPGLSTLELDISTVPSGAYQVRTGNATTLKNHKLIVE